MISNSYIDRLAKIESGNDPLARNPKSSAKGRFQFIDSTARQYGIDAKFGTPEYESQETIAVKRFTTDNYNYLNKELGRRPSNGELYLAHQQGAGGATKLLLNPDAKAVDILGKDQVINNGGNENMTAREFSAKWTDKFKDLDNNPPEGQKIEYPREVLIDVLKKRGVDTSAYDAPIESAKATREIGRDELINTLKKRNQYHLYTQSLKQKNIDNIEQELTVLKNQKEKGLGTRIYEMALGREKNIQDVRLKAEQAGIKYASILPNLGEGIAFLGDVSFELVKTGAETVSPQFVDFVGETVTAVVSSIANTPPAQMATEKYAKFKEEHFLIAENIEGGLSSAVFFFPVAKGGEKVIDSGSKAIDAIPQSVQYQIEKLGNLSRPSLQIDYTDRAIKRLLKTSNRTYEELLDTLRSADTLTIADIAGDEIQGLTRSIGKMKGAKNLIHGTLTERAEGAVLRVSEQLSKNFSSIESYFGTLEEMAKARNAAARPLYKKAYLEAPEILDLRINKYLQDKRVIDAINEAKAKYGLRLEAPNNSLEALDGAKKVLFDLESQAKIQGAKGLSNSYKDLRQGLVEVLDASSPTYAQARKVYEHPSKMIDAQQAGFNFSSVLPEKLKIDLGKMSPDEIEAFRIGVRASLQRTVSNINDGSDPARRIFGNSNKREQLEAIFPDQYDEFSKAMKDEMITFKTRNAILGGSRTDYNIAEDGAFIDAIADSARRGLIASSIDKAADLTVNAVKKRYIGITDKNAEDVARILLDREKGIEALQKLIKQQSNMEQKAIINNFAKNHGLVIMFNKTTKPDIGYEEK